MFFHLFTDFSVLLSILAAIVVGGLGAGFVASRVFGKEFHPWMIVGATVLGVAVGSFVVWRARGFTPPQIASVAQEIRTTLETRGEKVIDVALDKDGWTLNGVATVERNGAPTRLGCEARLNEDRKSWVWTCR